MRSYFKNGVAIQSDADAVEAELLSANQQLAQPQSARAGYSRMLARSKSSKKFHTQGS